MTSEQFIKAIEHVLWVKHAECVFVNPKDYTTHLDAFSHKRFEPNTHVQLLETGWVGTYGMFEVLGEPGLSCLPKPIYVRREIEEGTVVGAKLPTGFNLCTEIEP